MLWSREFIDLVLCFADKVREMSGASIEDVLLTSTPLYLNFGLSRYFDPEDLIWQEFLAGYRRACDPVAWSHSFYVAHARQYDATPYGCFSYHFEPKAQTIRVHFGNRESLSPGPLSLERLPARRRELAAMFADIRRDELEAEEVRGRSWMYNLPVYCRLFPTEYVQSAVAIEPELQFMSSWGQFLDRSWNLRPEPAKIFHERSSTAQTLDAVLASFPLPVLGPRCCIDHFYTFFGIESR